MKNESFNKRRILGLDIGVSSVGWAVVEEYQENKWTLHDFGVRMFEYPIDNQKNISLAEQRRMIRSRRRLVRRRQERIKRLKKIFERFSLVTIDEIENHFKKINDKSDDYKYCDDFNPYKIRYKAINGEKINNLQLLIALINISKSRGYDDTFIKLENLESKGSEDENGINYKNSVLYGDQLIQEYKYPIIALSNVELKLSGKKNEKFEIVGNRNFLKKGRIHEPFYFPRYSYIDEVREILNKQKKHLNLSNEFINLIAGDKNQKKNESVIFSQRSFEEGPGNSEDKKRKYKGFLDKLGRDIFYNEPRMWKSSLEGDLFFIISELSKISVPNVTKSILKNIFTDIYNSYLDNKLDSFLNDKKELFSKKNLKNLFKKYDKDNLIDLDTISIGNSKNSKYRFFLNWCNLFLNENFVKEELEKFKNGDEDNKLNFIGKIIAENITPWKFIGELEKQDFYKYFDFEKINDYISNHEGLRRKKFKNNWEKIVILRGLINSSPSNISKKYFKNVKNAFLNGIRYGDFQATFFKEKENSTNKIVREAFGPILDSNIRDNPVVCRSLSQSRKVVKALYDEYKWFDSIVVETARELSKSIEERNSIVNNNEINYEKNLFFKNELEKNNLRINPKNIGKIRLWYEQNFKDPYTLKDIDIKNFDSYDIDHIIPVSKNGPDIFDNKVLTLSSYNRDTKKDNLPLECIKDKNEIKEFKEYVYKNKNFSKRKKEYLLLQKIDKDIFEGFSNKELTDTRYISKYFSIYLEESIKLYKKENPIYENLKHNIFNVLGQITSTYRKLWLKDTPWGLDIKPRDITHFHHAVDAIILANFSSKSRIEFFTDVKILLKAKWNAKNNENSKNSFERIFDEIKSKWEGFIVNQDNGEVRKTNLWFKDSLKILEEIKDKDKIKLDWYLKPIVDSIDSHVLRRIPIKLGIIDDNIKGYFDYSNNSFRKVKTEENIEKNKKDEIKAESVSLKKEIPCFERTIEEQDYDLENLKKEFPNSNIRYPMISWKQKNKINNEITGSDQLVKKKEYLKQKENKKRNIIKIIKNNSTDYLDVSSYYGTLIYKDSKNNKFTFKHIRNILVSKTHKYINCKNILRPYTYFEVKDGYNKKTYIYTGVSCNQILCSSPLIPKSYAKILGDYRLSAQSNKVKNREFKILKFDILGRKI